VESSGGSTVGAAVDAESLRDLLVNKLCALLSRSEIRDLVDVQALASHGVSLDDAILSAPKKDGGFSPLTLAWVLQKFDVRSPVVTAGLSDSDVERLDAFRVALIEQLVSRQ
jgi:hypothetical protein